MPDVNWGDWDGSSPEFLPARECDMECEGSTPSQSDGMKLCVYCRVGEVVMLGDVCVQNSKAIRKISRRLKQILEPDAVYSDEVASGTESDMVGAIEGLLERAVAIRDLGRRNRGY